MARVAVIVEILPVDQGVNLDELIKKVEENLPEGFKLKDSQIKPIAFGLSLVRAIFTVPEEEGVTEKLEKYLSGFEEIQEVNVVMASRL
ncbi:MAG: elongation factor 1-beta [Thaumarchaeota archaeon]|nr:elongation factor 1-beta [Nitrososphaerota archaeon]